MWGDKTPSYINSIELLNKSFLNAKFIHIIRDPRDNVVSARNAWNKNLYRAAQRWSNSVVNFKTYSRKNKISLLEIKFEDLLEIPKKTISEICAFLDIDYDDNMLILRKSAENIGYAKGAKSIISENKIKFSKTLSKKQIKKIEEFAYNGMKMYDYQILYAKEKKQLSAGRLFVYKMFDITNRVFFNFRAYGVFSGLKFTLLSLFRLNK